MRIQIGAIAAGAASLLALSLLSPATSNAGTSFTITVEPTTVHVEQAFTVTGSVPSCPESPYTVTFSYTDVNDAPATATAEGTTDGEGAFTKQMAVPADALPDDAQEAETPTPPNVQASVTCGSQSAPPTTTTAPPPEGVSGPAALPAAPAKAAGGSATTSNTVSMSITFAEGVLSTDKASGRAGDVVHVAGTNCLGVQAFAALASDDGADVFDVTLDAEANTFQTDYTVPNFPPGQYVFAALCNGTEYNEVPFTLLATPGAPSPTPLPSEAPPVPITGPVNFTG